MYKIVISNRINWIDWAKVIAISLVVFGHIPMISGNFPQKYITNFHMPLFFLISGFLTKKECFNTETMMKYWHTLVIPYFFYNIIFYPYWIIRHLVDVPDAELFDFVKPLIGTLLLQLRTPISTPLNEVTWFVAVLLVMKILLSITNLYKNGNVIMVVFSVLCAIIYICNEHYRICENLPVIGFYRCLPFYYIGHLCKQKLLIPKASTKNDLYYFLGASGISIISYHYLYQQPSSLVTNGFIYLVAAFAVIGTLRFCRLLDKIHSPIIDNVSLGTIVIMGLHWMLIGTTNFILAKILHLEVGITYSFGITILLTLLYEALLYPVIILFKKRLPFLLGKYKSTRQQ